MMAKVRLVVYCTGHFLLQAGYQKQKYKDHRLYYVFRNTFKYPQIIIYIKLDYKLLITVPHLVDHV